MNEQPTNSDEAAIAAEFNARSAAAARDIVNGHQDAPIQEGVEHGPHLVQEDAKYPSADVVSANKRKVQEAHEQGYITRGAKWELDKERLEDTNADRWTTNGLIPKGQKVQKVSPQKKLEKRISEQAEEATQRRIRNH